MGKFLRIFFGCHGRQDRSFFYKGKQFPICARCTGELVGIIFSILMIAVYKNISLFWSILIMIPLVIDGTLQLLTSYESNNTKRFITGFLFGIGFICTILHIHLFIVEFIRNELTKRFGPPPYIKISLK